MKYIYPIILLAVSNIFMTFAWYGHLRFKSHGLWSVILISWLIAFFEYCFQVPANRLGLFRNPAQSNSGSHHPCNFHSFFHILHERRLPLEPCCRISADFACCIFHIQKMGLTHLGFSLSSTDIAYKIIPDAAKDI